MIVPKRAPVRPRVISAVSGDSLLLEEEVRGLIARQRRGTIFLAGPPGSGKTTALAHLALVLADADILFLDCPDPEDLLPDSRNRWIVFTSFAFATSLPFTDAYCLAPWREDEWIEYLLATAKGRCGSAMARARADAGRNLIDGNPELSAIVLDRLVVRDAIASVRAALVDYLQERFPDVALQALARRASLEVLLDPSIDPSIAMQSQDPGAEALLRFMRHRPIQLLLAGTKIVTDLRDGEQCAYFGQPFPRDLVRETAGGLAGEPALREVLIGWLSGRRERHAMAASILHAAVCHWTPPAGGNLRLTGAYFDHAIWPEVDLSGVDLQLADLSHADLRRANLASARLSEADLRQANLHEAHLAKVVALKTNLAGAILNGADLQGAVLDDASLDRAELRAANLRAASLTGATLTGASFHGADLQQACLVQAVIEGADFTGANLEGANLEGLKLSDACFAGARFRGARLTASDLEDMELPGADFQDANLEKALLTGSMMHAAKFDRARLGNAGLAEIDWEGVSMRGADMRGVSFHLGSTRCGLVGSPIACEGSRTGFYTDDFTEQDFKSPEEIRKANLCHADLRGALTDGVDFYLVDLRHAQFDPAQEEHFRRCGAILGRRSS
jgi:uncharacterized protein YjbI with pentapeptide repeats